MFQNNSPKLSFYLAQPMQQRKTFVLNEANQIFSWNLKTTSACVWNLRSSRIQTCRQKSKENWSAKRIRTQRDSAKQRQKMKLSPNCFLFPKSTFCCRLKCDPVFGLQQIYIHCHNVFPIPTFVNKACFCSLWYKEV